MQQITDTLGSLSQKDQDALQKELRDLAEDFLTAALTTPFGIRIGPPDMPLSKRARWAERHLFMPANDLLNALSDANAPLRSGWPDLLDFEGPDRRVLINELEKLKEYAKQLVWNLQDRSETTPQPNTHGRGIHSRGANHTQEFKIELAESIRLVMIKYYINLSQSRGTYDSEFGMIGKFPKIMEICFNEIIEEKLSDHLLRTLLRPMRDDGAFSPS